MKVQYLFAVLTAVLLSACAGQQTEYKPAQERGQPGYTETRLGENRYRVTFTGNYQTDRETVQDYALLRAAELTLQEGRDWFRMAARESDKESRTTVQGGGVSHSRGYSTVHRRCGLLSCDTVVHHRTVPAGGGAATTRTRDAHSTSLEIVMGSGDLPEEVDVDVFDARELASNLRRWMGERR